MSGHTILQAAVDELYSNPMAEFTARRKTLAAAARKAGDRDAAGRIAALRKPTLSADTLNRLVRAASGEVDQLLALGQDLRAAEKALNGPELRELSNRRRQLVSDLADLAFEISEHPSPSASVRDEVAATLNAALADEQIAQLLVSGVLVTQARWDGFGSASLPELATVLPMTTARPQTPAPQTPARTDQPARRSRTADADQQAAAQQAAAQQAAAQQAAAQQAAAAVEVAQARQRRLAAASQESVDADGAAAAARQHVTEIDRRISELNLQLAHQRQMLARAQQQAREAEIRSRSAKVTLTRLGGSPADG